MTKNEMPGGVPITELTGKPTDAQTQIVRAINMTVAGQEIAKDIELAPQINEKITAFAKSEPKTVEGAEWLPPEDFKEKILVVALPEQPAVLADTGVFLAGDFTKWDVEAWSFTHLDKNVFALKAKGVKGQQCKFFAHHDKMPVAILAQFLTKSGIEKPGVDANKGNAWFLSGGKQPSGAFQNDTW